MTTIIEGNENSALISIPLEELKRLGLNVGDELEITASEEGLLIRSAQDKDRKIAEATEKIFDRWNTVFVELAKGIDEK